MAKNEQALLFIDTNILLDFYRAEGEAGLTLLKRIESVSDRLILTDQVETEFLNNRQKVILSALQNVKTLPTPNVLPAYLSDTKIATGLAKNLKQINQRIDSLKKRFTRVLKNPASYDPVFKIVRKVFAASSELKMNSSKHPEIISMAQIRFQRGFPPRKRQDNSIGDAINWEWILNCAKNKRQNVIIISRDSDYGILQEGKSYLNDWLQQEFKDRVSSKRNIELNQSLAQVLKRLSVAVTPAEEEEEKIIIQARVDNTANMLHAPPFWTELITHVKRQSPFTAIYMGSAIFANLEDGALTIGFGEDFHHYAEMIDREKPKNLIATKIREMKLGENVLVKIEKLVSGPAAPELY